MSNTENTNEENETLTADELAGLSFVVEGLKQLADAFHGSIKFRSIPNTKYNQGYRQALFDVQNDVSRLLEVFRERAAAAEVAQNSPVSPVEALSGEEAILDYNEVVEVSTTIQEERN
jgi:hypothetical protein